MNQLDLYQSITDRGVAVGKRLLVVIVFSTVFGCFEHSKDDKSGDLSDSGERSSDDAGTGSPVDNQVSAAVDETGGRIELEDVYLRIPEGALDEKVKIGIKVVEPPVPFPDEYKQVSDVYECTPHGYEFEEPVRIEIDFREVADGSTVLLRLEDDKDKSWDVVDSVRFRSGLAEFEVDRFSFFAVAYRVEQALGTPDASVPNAGGGTGGIGGISGYGGIGGSGGFVVSLDGGFGAVDLDDICTVLRAELRPLETEIQVEVPYEVTYSEPIAIYLMIDKSNSMNEVSGTSTKWAIAVDAISEFVDDSNSEFLDVGLQYFPLNTPSCDGTEYDTPAVPIGALPDNADNISSSLASTILGQFTPIEPALRGMTSFCAQFQAQNPDEPCVGVLISDGAPTQCAIEANVLISISQNAFDNSNVRTFAVGMAGADFDLLNQIAMWGGTDCTPDNTSDGYACDVSAGMTLIEAFGKIRDAITTLVTRTEYRIETRTEILECEWGIPELPEGEVFNKDYVNVVFSEPGKPEEIIPKIPAGRSCDGFSSTGWHYDNEASPTRIIACRGTCDYITSVETDGSMDIQYGCDTIVKL